MRPVTLYEKPPFPPYVCVYCGVGEKPRKWFLDPGLSLDYYFNPVNDGTPFICNECWNNLKVQAERVINNWVAENAGWESPDRVAATYNWKDGNGEVEERQELPQQTIDLEFETEEEEEVESDVRGPESTDREPASAGRLIFSSGADPSAEGHYSSTESDDSINEPDDEQSQNAFTAIFGERP